MEGPIAVAIIHNSQLIREGIRDLLNKQPGVRASGAFGSAREAFEQPVQGDHVLLYDLGTSHQDGPALMQELRERVPQGKVLVFGVADDVQAILECVRAGASGCILDNVSVDDLVSAIHSVSNGTPSMSPKVVTTLFNYVARLQAGDDSPPSTPLTAREEQVLQMMAEGLDNKEIAQKLYLQPQTVKNYVHQVLQKLNLHNRLEVIRSRRSTKH
ncbi:MAG: LuxR C-terminal-related transcriptional regulator [Armatimonadota bacterium]